MVAIFAIIGVVLLALAGLNVGGGGRFSLGWLGLAFVALAAFWPAIIHLGG